MKITLKSGDVREYAAAMPAIEIAKSISEGLARNVCAAKVNGETVDLRTEISEDCELTFLTFEDEDGRGAFRHTAAHILAQAVKRLFPETKLAIGPSIADGFYYDFDRDGGFTPEDLEKIEAEMKKIVKEDLKLERFTLSREEAVKLMNELGEPYKVELIEALPEDAEISFYKQGEYTDLCAGPHIASTKAVKAFKLTSIAGAYWHGDEKNKMLSRIYGTAFPKASELEEHLARIEEAKKRDHRKLGKELGLFTMVEEGPGFPIFLPKGMALKNTLLEYWRSVHRRYGYVEVQTPQILNRDLWLRSGHWDHYKENMYTTVIDDMDYAIKPMNCPGGMLVYKSQPRSYRDLPLRMAELGTVHRHELSGALHGLFRVRVFTQDDAHIFMTWDQMKDEIMKCVQIFDEIYTTFGLTYKIEVSTMPEDHIGEEETWRGAEEILKDAITAMGKGYTINEGDGAFYGPKLDFKLSDSLGRTWQCGTIQLDMQLPERFELEYTGADGEKHRPVMIHRALLGSIERFIGVITEHFAGAFPTWLAPVQVKLLPITDRTHEYAQQIYDKLFDLGYRVENDTRSEKIGYKIRQAQLEKVPYMLVLGDKEAEAGMVAVRDRKTGETTTMTFDEFVAKLEVEVKTRVH